MEKQSVDDLRKEVKRLKQHLEEKTREIESLKWSRLFLESIFDGISDEILILDDDYTILNANKTFLENYGLEKDRAVGKKCYEIKQHSGGPCAWENTTCPLDEARNTAKRVKMTHEHTPDGENAKKFLIDMFPIVLENGRISCFAEIARELTDYKALARRLQASEKRFRAILDTATNAILSIDESHRIILFNKAAQRIFGYSPLEILGKDLGILIPERYGDHHVFVKRFLERRESEIMGKTLSLAALHKEGWEFPVELSLSHIELDGRTTFTAIIRDVSERRHLEKKLLQSERLAAVGQAVAHVAHEIKNPLMIIGGFTSQLKKSLTGEKDLHKLNMILDEVGRLERLVAGLGDFTKTYRLTKKMANVNDILRDVMKIMAEVYPPNRYGFREELSDQIQEIHCDPDKLKQVFINIVSNGFQAMNEGGKIAVSTESIPEGVEIRISDEGVGIPEEDLHHIFEPFYTTRERGSGLGLPISYKIVEAHEGDISAVSRPGKGTTFIIRLPAC
ncbi:MAG: PAS domain S-box protein [Deltaproteobacteria bacterium]|nr:PAS domain S-box protein [Deltaproteobacteria bacterium]MBW2016324.1 PAS domain S-box protein [Deltaproteobacteria bacterium]MBW2128908.1 PAS domain S-box protein [Deltaproteobacteria bacterium]MBW2303869.1 PAS domain S-box protein [Deltaproteobacteria bacterium]